MDIYIENDTIKNITKNIKIPLKKLKNMKFFLQNLCSLDSLIYIILGIQF